MPNSPFVASLGLLGTLIGSAVAAQEASPPAEAAIQPAEPPTEQGGWFQRNLTDSEDGKFDVSGLLAKGGFIPMPVIITEPAVDGGFGIVAQFVTMNPENPQEVTRRMLGGVKTGNGSWGVGAFQSGQALDGRLSYKFGLGTGKVNLDMYPSFAPNGIGYTNRYKLGLFGSALWHLPDRRFSFGPIIDFRWLKSSLDLPDLPEPLDRDFERKLHTAALGGGVHFDSRDNPVTPTKGLNAFAEGKFYDGAFGSDRDFQIYDVDAYAFHPMSDDFRLSLKVEMDAARGNFPSFFAPSIDLRGVQSGRYQGSTAFSNEAEMTWQLAERWSLVGFGGVGFTEAGSKRLFDNSGAIFAGGGGFRYRIARKLGIDAGADVAVGPGGTIFYIQFGHAWSMGMD